MSRRIVSRALTPTAYGIALLSLGCGGAPKVEDRWATVASADHTAPWPTEVEGIDDAQRLFAGRQPCVLRAEGVVDCVEAGLALGFDDVEHDLAQLHFAWQQAPSLERASVEAEMVEWREGLVRGEVQAPGVFRWTHTPRPFDAPQLAIAFTAPRVEIGGGCAVVLEGRDIACWGDDESSSVDVPHITAMPEGEVAVEVSFSVERMSILHCMGCISGPHTCARMASGRVACWGWNAVGQLGNGTRIDAGTPVFVEGINDAQSLATGTHHNCVIHRDQTVSCWGHGVHGQLGDGDRENRTRPVRVHHLQHAVSLSLSAEHSCAITAEGSAHCWGPTSHFGVRVVNAFEPILLEASERLVEAAAGTRYTCARSESGRVFCGGMY